MSAPVIYDSAVPYCNGKQLSQATSVSLTYQDSDKPLMLLGGGKKFLFTVEPGARLLKIEIDECIPITGQEFDYINLYLLSSVVSFGVKLLGSGKTLISRGYLSAPSLGVKVGSNTMFRVGFIGSPVNFDGA